MALFHFHVMEILLVGFAIQMLRLTKGHVRHVRIGRLEQILVAVVGTLQGFGMWHHHVNIDESAFYKAPKVLVFRPSPLMRFFSQASPQSMATPFGQCRALGSGSGHTVVDGIVCVRLLLACGTTNANIGSSFSSLGIASGMRTGHLSSSQTLSNLDAWCVVLAPTATTGLERSLPPVWCLHLFFSLSRTM
jgi:hypothetical protein